MCSTSMCAIQINKVGLRPIVYYTLTAPLKLKFESTIDKIIMDKMTIKLDVFSPFIEYIIVSNMNDILVITIKRSSRGCRHT